MTSTIASSTNNFLNALGQLGSQVAKGAEHVVTDLIDSTTQDVKAFGKAVEQGNLVGAAAAFYDATSLGRTVEKGLGAVGAMPDKPTVAGNIVSALVNAATANPVAAAVDIAQAIELSQAPTKSGTAPAKGHTVERPSSDAACHDEKARWGAAPLDGRTREPRVVLSDIETRHGELIARIEDGARAPRAGKVEGRPSSGSEMDAILGDKSLCFEDMLALFMMKFASEMRSEITEQAKELGKVNGKLRALNEPGRGASTAEGASTAADAKGTSAAKTDTPAASASTQERDDEKSALQNSREEMAEKLKLLNDRLNEFTQTMSNILNSQHQTAMNAIGNIR